MQTMPSPAQSCCELAELSPAAPSGVDAGALQVIITYNKEAVLSEKQMSAHFGQTILVGYSRLLDPANFSEPQAFFDEVQRVWDAEWQRVYSADWSGTVCIDLMWTAMLTLDTCS